MTVIAVEAALDHVQRTRKGYAVDVDAIMSPSTKQHARRHVMQKPDAWYHAPRQVIARVVGMDAKMAGARHVRP